MYLESLAATSSNQQDPDAQYNLLFSSVPFNLQGEGDTALYGLSYALNFLGDSTNWTF
jgi:hypothetical protein